MEAVAAFLIDLNPAADKIRLSPLFPDKFQHTGVSGDHHTESIGIQSGFHTVNQLGLIVGVSLKYVPDAESLQYPAKRYLLGRFIEILPRRRMILVAGHGCCPVLHDYQADPVFVEQDVQYPGQTGVKKGGIPQKGHHLSRIIEKRKT
jgi:hypothetical protein